MNLSTLLAAMIMVESGGNDWAVGDNRKALGSLQIHSAVVKDVNRIAGTRWRHRDMHRRDAAVFVATVYLAHYGDKSRLGREATAEDLARIWVGGPDGWRERETVPYWKRVQRHLPEPQWVR